MDGSNSVFENDFFCVHNDIILSLLCVIALVYFDLSD